MRNICRSLLFAVALTFVATTWACPVCREKVSKLASQRTNYQELRKRNETALARLAADSKANSMRIKIKSNLVVIDLALQTIANETEYLNNALNKGDCAACNK